MQANCCTKQSALLNAQTLTWTLTGKGKYDVNDEEGWNLLPDGTVLAVDAYVFHYEPDGKNYEIYNPSKGTWKSGPASGTVVQLWDSYPNAKQASYELGPGVLRPDGTVFYAGANGAPGMPGHTAIYDTQTKTWTAGPDFPDALDIADGPASLLPDGNVLVQASPGIFNLGSKFLVWNGTTFINVTGGNTDAPNVSSYYGNMLLLPTGEVLWTDFGDVWVYQHGGTPNPNWAPQITSLPTDLKRGSSYVVSGFNFNGFSPGRRLWRRCPGGNQLSAGPHHQPDHRCRFLRPNPRPQHHGHRIYHSGLYPLRHAEEHGNRPERLPGCLQRHRISCRYRKCGIETRYFTGYPTLRFEGWAIHLHR